MKGPRASHYTIQPGETGRDRTFDLGDVNAALSQLSYALWYRMKESDLRLLDVNQSRYHYANPARSQGGIRAHELSLFIGLPKTGFLRGTVGRTRTSNHRHIRSALFQLSYVRWCRR